MRSQTKKLSREFFEQPAEVVAPALLGCHLVIDDHAANRVEARLVEVEAYLGTSDPASHAFRGPTPRAAVMFGPPGHLYVYLSYGIHHCVNIVTNPDEVAGAVLLRSAEVVSGHSVVRRRRRAPLVADHALLSGPGNLGKGLELSRDDNGMDLFGSQSRMLLFQERMDGVIDVTRRIGVTRGADALLRFSIRGHPAVSARTGQKPGT